MKLLNKSNYANIAFVFLIIEGIVSGVLGQDGVVYDVARASGAFAMVISTFFIAEGYKHTSSSGEYVRRVLDFWLLSIAPYFLLYRKTAVYKQGILFDLLLALVVLSLCDYIYASKAAKIFGSIGICIVSLFISSKPIIAIALVLIWRYIKSTKVRFILVSVALACYSGVTALLSMLLHDTFPVLVNWNATENAYYILGALALPLLLMYTGKPGKNPFFELFYYVLCPIQYLVLFVFSIIFGKSGYFGLLCSYHAALIILLILAMLYMLRQQPTKAYMSITMMMAFAGVYIFGYILEISSQSLQGIQNAIKIEYLGLCLVLLFLTWFIAEFTAKTVPFFIYVIQVIITVTLVSFVATIGRNNFFYTSMHVTRSGSFPIVELSYGPAFYSFCLYVAALEIYQFIHILRTLRNSEGAERKRAFWLAFGFFFPVLAMILKFAGATGNFAPLSTALVVGGCCELIALLRYGSLDPIHVATQSLLNSNNRGVIILNKFQNIAYFNDLASEIFPNISLNMSFNSLFRVPFESLSDAIRKKFVSGDHIYELHSEPLTKASYIQGYIISAEDVTFHEEEVQAAKSKASTDALTGLSTRSYYIERINEFFSHQNVGSLMMIDVDNFKHVNDNYGHDVGDKVLQAVGKALLALDGRNIYTCRMGGDEFSVFVPSTVKINILAEIAQSIIDNFKGILLDECLPEGVTISIGIVTTDSINEPSDSLYENLYRKADNALYLSKSKGKARYNFYK